MFGLEGIIVTGLFKIFLAIFGILAGRLTLKWMDKHIEHSTSPFAKWLNDADDAAKGLYYGARIIAVCIVIAGAIG